MAVLDQDLAELSGYVLVETLQDQISPSAWPKLILMPSASVTLRPGETSLTSPLLLVADHVCTERFFKPQIEASAGCLVTAATGCVKSYFFSSSTWCAKSCVS